MEFLIHVCSSSMRGSSGSVKAAASADRRAAVFLAPAVSKVFAFVKRCMAGGSQNSMFFRNCVSTHIHRWLIRRSWWDKHFKNISFSTVFCFLLSHHFPHPPHHFSPFPGRLRGRWGCGQGVAGLCVRVQKLDTPWLVQVVEPWFVYWLPRYPSDLLSGCHGNATYLVCSVGLMHARKQGVVIEQAECQGQWHAHITPPSLPTPFPSHIFSETNILCRFFFFFRKNFCPFCILS